MFISVISFLKEAPGLVFWASALFGTVLFILRLCATIIDGFSEELHESDDMMIEDADKYHHHTGSFKLFTLHSISGFFMMFGWVGLACAKQLHCSQHIAILFSFIAGFTTMLLTALIFKWSQLLVSSGTRFDIEKTVGMVGTVYQRISHKGQGKIQLVVDGVTRELLAQSHDNHSIESFCSVEVVGVLDYETVLVKRITLL